MPGTWRPALAAAAMACMLAGCETGAIASLGPAAAPPAASAIGGGPGPAATEAPLARAKAAFRERDFGLAEKWYRAAVEARPDDSAAWIGLAAVYDELRRFDLADRAYAQALRLTGPTAQFLNNRGYSFLMRGDYAKARRDLAAARRKDPENATIARNIGALPR